MKVYMIHLQRVQRLNKKKIRSGDYVLYWMQSAQRVEYNHALEYAVQQANELDKPLLVLFGITDSFPEANARHYMFMLEGLREVKRSLEARGIQMMIQIESPEKAAVKLGKNTSLVITNRGYLRV